MNYREMMGRERENKLIFLKKEPYLLLLVVISDYFYDSQKPNQ